MVNKSSKNTQGSVLVGVLVATIFLAALFISLTTLAGANLDRAKSRVFQLQAQYSAESGVDAAIANLNNNSESYTGSGSEVTVLSADRYRSTFSSTVAAGSSNKEKIITSVGKVYVPATATTPSYYRTVQVTAQRSSGTVTTSILSRNIIDIGSGVKNIWGVDIYANGYIRLNKNTTSLIAENISVAGKYTTAANCSITGTGNLLKPTSFSHSGQTKTIINTSYNNCLSPPGNTSNSNFSVSANNPVSSIVSTYVPWGQFMDNSYTANSSGCTDWTKSGSTLNIPSGSDLKATHYPDTSSNIASSCGTSGNINLSTKRFNIKANVHVRANFCSASACDPIFYNPDSTIKYIFLEGTANFQSLTTASGSGPIVLVTYGADPNSHGSACPSTTGDSIYLGQHGSAKTIAPKIYLLAKNGVCVDGTKFDNSNESLGGMSGKNIYIAASPGNPYDLKLDSSFPVDQVPVDLSWRAVRYRHK